MKPGTVLFFLIFTITAQAHSVFPRTYADARAKFSAATPIDPSQTLAASNWRCTSRQNSEGNGDLSYLNYFIYSIGTAPGSLTLNFVAGDWNGENWYQIYNGDGGFTPLTQVNPTCFKEPSNDFIFCPRTDKNNQLSLEIIYPHDQAVPSTDAPLSDSSALPALEAPAGYYTQGYMSCQPAPTVTPIASDNYANLRNTFSKLQNLTIPEMTMNAPWTCFSYSFSAANSEWAETEFESASTNQFVNGVLLGMNLSQELVSQKSYSYNLSGYRFDPATSSIVIENLNFMNSNIPGESAPPYPLTGITDSNLAATNYERCFLK